MDLDLEVQTTAQEIMLTVTRVIVVVLAYVTANVRSVKTMVSVTIIMVALAALLLDRVLPIAISVTVLIATVKVNVSNAITIMMAGEKHQNQLELITTTTMKEMVVSLLKNTTANVKSV